MLRFTPFFVTWISFFLIAGNTSYQKYAAASANKTKKAKTYSVSISIEHYYPYCNGAAPTEGQQDNRQPEKYGDFVIINEATGKKTTVQTDANGKLNAILAPGKYGIKEGYKDCTFEEFLFKNPIVENEFIQGASKECYKTWWESYLGEFTIAEDGTIPANLSFVVYESCFTGVNPCIKYVGPMPP